MRRAYKFWLRPNDYQKKRLEQSLETHRRIYNEALAMRKEAYEKEKKTIKPMELYRHFTARMKKEKEEEKAGKEGPHWYASLCAISIRDTLDRLDKAFQNFFRRVKSGGTPGYPRFKNRDRYTSIPFQYPSKSGGGGAGCILFDGNNKKIYGDQKDSVSCRIRIYGVGSVRVKAHRSIKGVIKTVTIKREADKWYAVFSCDLGETEVKQSENPPIGLDVGIKTFAVDSDGEAYENPKYLNKNLKEIKQLSRKIALRDGKKRKTRQYCQCGSKRRNLNKKKLQKLHEKVKNQRKENHHQISLKLVRRAGLIAVEDLNVKGMVRNHRLARAIADAGWSGFVNILKCKAESAGVRIVEVDPRGTTQQCSNCGRPQDEKIELGDRWYTCQHCGSSLDRDHNAAINILNRGLRQARAEPASDRSSINGHWAVRSKTVDCSITLEPRRPLAAQNATGKQP